ncbi:hypothetical protein [Polymorphospora lycopeni]|uniref:Uncharacterized protein n=1 Tax=Polymorphospora lycopeni TaxID=3140240 RepID=A0ABV5CL88_9ACTN
MPDPGAWRGTAADEIHAPLGYPPHAHIPYAAARHAATVMCKTYDLPGLECAR